MQVRGYLAEQGALDLKILGNSFDDPVAFL